MGLEKITLDGGSGVGEGRHSRLADTCSERETGITKSRAKISHPLCVPWDLDRR